MTELIPTLAVRVLTDSVELSLRVSNGGESAVTLEFATSQRYDFVVRSEAGEELWRWSADRMFAEMLGREELSAGGTVEYREVWEPGGRTGRFLAEGRLVTLSEPVSLETEFELVGS